MRFDLMRAMLVLATSDTPEAVQTPDAEAALAGDHTLEGAALGADTDTDSESGWDDLDAETATEPATEVAPPQPEGPTPAELEHKKQLQKARGLTAGGWTTFGVTYAAALTLGVASIDLANGDQRKRTWGRRMAIPVGGPFAAAFVSASATGTLFTVLTGAAQITGIVLGTAGAVMLARHKRDPNFAFAIVPDAAGGAHMGATWRF
jgi:hypothetical protein